jgi:hypothetical protein
MRNNMLNKLSGWKQLMHLTKFIVIAFLGGIALVGCTAYRTTLINAQGRTATCESKWGRDTGHYFECINAAKAQGFTEMPDYESERRHK